MAVFLERLKLALTLLGPTWLIITLLLMFWEPIIVSMAAWQVAALIAPQVIMIVTFLITPLAQKFLNRK
ncbi:hypothetical protein [Kushneria aurantia]|uniref:Uncharacterized protein n=1 Tax=Kushneria aurantia TaxID=504092 RepID=A0ABV6G0H7_9GAMM|nr:hypothetical protein [Kushneria aurantia]